MPPILFVLKYHLAKHSERSSISLLNLKAGKNILRIMDLFLHFGLILFLSNSLLFIKVGGTNKNSTHDLVGQTKC